MFWRIFGLATLSCFGLMNFAIAQDADEDDLQGFAEEEERVDDRGPGGAREDREGRGERGGPENRGFRGRGPQNLMFTAIDEDGDGEITSNELRKAATALKSLDTNGDGVITMDEASPRRGPGGDPSGFVDRIMENDANGDGKLTPDEVNEQLGRMLTGADTNGDGAVDREELAAAAQNFRGIGRGGRGGFGGPNADPDQMTRQLMAGDRNGDGVLSPQEVPQQSLGMLRDADIDGDGFLSASEVRQAMETARQRFERFQGGRGGRGGREERGADGDPRDSFRPERDR